MKDCYQDNKLIKGELRIGDRLVDLRKITMPLLNIYASADHLVPPAATRPLNDCVSTADKTLYEFKGGHIGVFVGSKSQKELAPTIATWLHERDGEGHAKVSPAAENTGTEKTGQAPEKKHTPKDKGLNKTK
jgi:polyhydroxyalkanoate synthase